jgi:hypothetical protein
MTAMSDFAGYVASSLVLLTFMTKDMRLLRLIAVFSNLAFITYGTLVWLPPVLGLHLLLLPLNILRLNEAIASSPRQTDSASRGAFVWFERVIFSMHAQTRLR